MFLVLVRLCDRSAYSEYQVTSIKLGLLWCSCTPWTSSLFFVLARVRAFFEMERFNFDSSKRTSETFNLTCSLTSPGDFGPKLHSAGLIPSIASIIVETGLYGILFILAPLTLYTLLRRPEQSSLSSSTYMDKIVTLVCATQFCATTAVGFWFVYDLGVMLTEWK